MSGFGAFEALLDGGSRGPAVTPERLEIMGRKAATNLVDHGVPLNETISKEAAAIEGINGEHVKRACEFANQQTFLAMHKAASGNVRAPEFDIADYNTVMQDLGDGATPTQITQDDIDYATIPSRYEKSAGRASMEKAASAVIPKAAPIQHAFPLNEALDTRTKLASVHDEVSRELYQYERFGRDAYTTLVTKMATALEEGATPAQLAYVCLHVDSREEATKLAGLALGQALANAKIPDQVKTAGIRSGEIASLGGLEVDDTSPVARSFGALLDFNTKVAERKVALADVTQQRSKIETFLQSTVR